MLKVFYNSSSELIQIEFVLFNDEKEICTAALSCLFIEDYFLSIYIPSRFVEEKSSMIKVTPNSFIDCYYQFNIMFQNLVVYKELTVEQTIKLIMDIYNNELLIIKRLKDKSIFKIINNYLEEYLFSD